MCGIAGWLDPAVPAGPQADLRLKRMLNTILHRGPDDEGMAIMDGVGLGIRRLAIVDIAGGHQPMASADGRLTLVFNGEIFNHETLRAQLRQQGVTFRTASSDTEVLLKLYEREGVRCLHRLNGMFAAAIWDARAQTLCLMRDRMGVKPLYYAWNGHSLIFASEIKAILAALPTRPAVNQRAIWDYLTFRYVPAPLTMWQGIFKLPPAHHLTIGPGSGEPVVERWWDMPRPDTTMLREEDAIAQFDNLLTDATKLRMLADVPVGILLSGGLDSSIVAARAAQDGAKLRTFSIGFEGAPDIDERKYARQIAAHLGAEHQDMLIGAKEFQDFLPDLVHFTDEPLADAASVPLHYICKLARQSVTVALAGEGADETLGGYSFDSWAKRWDEAAACAAPPSLLDRLLRRPRASIDPGLLDLRRAQQPLTMTAYLDSAQKSRLLRDAGRQIDSLDTTRKSLEQFGQASPLAQALYTYCQDWLVEDLLMKADKMSMATSVEVRTPFLDYRLVEAAARLPDHLRVGRNRDGVYETKRILRLLARRSHIPDNIIQRPKMGFPVPIYGWLSNLLRDFVLEHLASPHARLTEWVEASTLDEIVRNGMAPTAESRDQHILFNFLILELWMRRWL